MYQDNNAYRTIAAAGAAEALRLLGLTAGELTYSRAQKTYGKWFTESVKSGRLRPARKGQGANGSLYFRVTDILNLKAQDEAPARLVFDNFKKQ